MLPYKVLQVLLFVNMTCEEKKRAESRKGKGRSPATHRRQGVFMERASYLYFLKGIKKYLCATKDGLAYVLMPTHFHLLGRVKQALNRPG